MGEQRKQKSLGALALKTAVGISLAVATFGVSVYIYGATLPETLSGSAEITIRAPIDEVFSLASDPRRATEWRDDLAEVHDYRQDRQGLAAWTEVDPRGGELPFRMLELDPPRRFVFTIDDEYAVFRGAWTFELTQTDGGVRVAISEQSLISNAFVRGMFSLFGNRDRPLQRLLQRLKAYSERDPG